MRIVAVHNYYGSAAPSGENNIVDTEIRMLRNAGHEVLMLERHSDEIRSSGWRGLVRGGLSAAWNPFEARRLRRMIGSFKPDVVHVHNTFPLISPAIFWAIPESVATVATLHNYRLFCAGAMLLRDGNVCMQCIEKGSVLPAVRFGCYRKSRVSTLPIAYGIALHKAIGTWRTKVDVFIAISEFQRDMMVRAGLPLSKTQVKPNFFGGSVEVRPWADREDVAVYVGRLAPEKGVEHLVQAWRLMGHAAPRLRIVGDGPLRTSLVDMARSVGGDKIEFVGQVSPDAAREEISRAKLLVVPSIWFEGFPIVLQDAFAAGTPTAVSNLGSLPQIVRDGVNGFVFEPNGAAAIAATIARVWSDEKLLVHVGQGARASYEAKYTEAINYQRLMSIYELAIGGRGVPTPAPPEGTTDLGDIARAAQANQIQDHEP